MGSIIGEIHEYVLFEGTWRKYHGGSNPDMWLQEAAAAAKEIIDNGPYSIYSTGDPTTDYNAIHRITADLTGVPEVDVLETISTGCLYQSRSKLSSQL